MKSFADHMAGMSGSDEGDGAELSADDYGGSLEKAMEDLAKHLADEEETGMGSGPPGGHAAMLLIPHGGK